MDFDQILDDCIHRMMDGSASLEDCLRNYPSETALEPLLRVALRLGREGLVHPSPVYKLWARTQLEHYLRAHPRDGQDPGEQAGSDDPASPQERDRALLLGLG